jgi:hypothetical protein
MTKRTMLIATTLLIALGAIAAIKVLAPASSSLAAPNKMTSSREAIFRDAVARERMGTMAIIPSPVIDHDAPLFVGTGDGSNGNWVRRLLPTNDCFCHWATLPAFE